MLKGLFTTLKEWTAKPVTLSYPEEKRKGGLLLFRSRNNSRYRTSKKAEYKSNEDEHQAHQCNRQRQVEAQPRMQPSVQPGLKVELPPLVTQARQNIDGRMGRRRLGGCRRCRALAQIVP